MCISSFLRVFLYYSATKPSQDESSVNKSTKHKFKMTSDGRLIITGDDLQQGRLFTMF